MAAYYNEIDPFAAQWLRNLIEAKRIAPGVVDERSIEDVAPDDLRGFKQCHFFAGVGVWSYALRLAGWPDDREVWTGSCPCQPFSAAGKRGGTADERHLWPAFFHLIDACRPPSVLGEQVASKDGLAWLDLVSADLEGAGYAFGASDLCAAGVGAPHIRQRLWFVGVADTGCEDQSGRGLQRPGQGDGQGLGSACERLEGLRATGGLGDTERGRPQSRDISENESALLSAATSGSSRLADNQSVGSGAGLRHLEQAGRGLAITGNGGAIRDERPCPTNGRWRDADWLLCRDERWRPVESGTFPLAHGAPSRVGRLRAYGNAIVAEAAREFIEAVDWSIGGDLV